MVSNRLNGEQIEELKQQAAAHFWPHARPAGDMSDDSGIKLVTSAKGVWVEDAEGKQWFDTISGMWLKTSATVGKRLPRPSSSRCRRSATRQGAPSAPPR